MTAQATAPGPHRAAAAMVAMLPKYRGPSQGLCVRRDPFCGDLFVFRSKRSDRVKILAWDGTGLVLYSKRLEMGRFTWPAIQDGVITLTASQLSVLLDGLDWRKVAPRAVDRPLRAG